jgi:hypothetical protein
VFTTVSGQIEGFTEHEDAVRKLLKDGKLALTKTNIVGAYTMVLGENILAEKAREARANLDVPPSDPSPPGDPEKDVELSALETEVMTAHGITDPKEWIKYRDKPPELKLPT